LLRRWNSDRGTSTRLELSPALAEQVLLASWPDNLRGLDRLVHRLAAQRFSDVISARQAASLLPDLFSASSEFPAAGHTPRPPAAPALSELGSSSGKPTREEFLRVYDDLGRNVRALAKHYDKDRRQIYRWLESYGIRREAGEGN
jgi:transcriptional regulator of acetoin/glycerol metabolism